MASIEISIDIHHPIGSVWDALSRLDRHAEWMADAERIDFVGESKSGVGTTMIVRTAVGPLRTNDVMVVTEWVEGQRISVEHTGVVEGTGTFELLPRGDVTSFTWSENLRFPWYLGGELGEVVAMPVLKGIWLGNLERFAMSIPDDLPTA
jgi:uncharacterized protein YndB with AHSA1/START domain